MKTIQAALAVILLSAAQPAVAGITHIRGVPVPPIQTVEQARAETDKRLAAIQTREAAEAKVAAQVTSSPSAITHSPLFFTGKPLVEETGQYVFLFRHYDPELNRWTTADPSGFPDGANNRIYAPNPLTELDPEGLRKSLGKPDVPTPTDFEYGNFESVAGSLFLRTRARWEYTGWAYTGVEGVGNVGEGATFSVSATISGSLSISLTGGVRFGVANAGATFGATGGMGAGGAWSQSKPAIPDVTWEAKGLIGQGHINIEYAYFELIDGEYQFAPGYSGYVHSEYAYSSHFKIGLGIEWFE